MGVHRLVSRCVASLLLPASIAAASVAGAQPLPSPSPGPKADPNAASISPLTEIGRVRARTPYCAALAGARPAVDAAITYQYALLTMYRDLRYFRLDSYLTKHQSLQRADRDLSALWNLAKAGRAEVQALRAAAMADGVDEVRRAEMLGFANALDGAKARQMDLAKSIARTVAVLGEAPIGDIINTPADDHAAADAVPSVQPYTGAQAEALEDHDRQSLFSAFGPERFIRDDLKAAAKHGTTAVQLGGCTNT